LAVTQILKGFRGILLSRSRIRIYWPVIAWAALLLMVCSQNWWSMFGMRNRHDWTFLQFAMVLLQTILIYMVAGLVFPDLFGEEVVDLKENFYAHRGWFLTLAFFSIVISVCKDFVLDGRLPNTTNLIFPGDLRRDVIHRRVDALGALPQRSRSFCQRALRRLYRRAFRPNSLSSTQSSHQSLQNFDYFHAPFSNFFPVHGGKVFDQLLAFGGELNVPSAPVSFTRFAGDEFSFSQAVDNIDGGVVSYLKAFAQFGDG
jgi:hypothetical protein